MKLPLAIKNKEQSTVCGHIMINKLFVYGTLGPGRPNEYIMSEIGGTWEEATVRGKLYEEGWGAELGYPGIYLDENGDIVDGFVFCSENLNNNWSKLDEFEGEAYERVIAHVQIKNGAIVESYIYALKKK